MTTYSTHKYHAYSNKHNNYMLRKAYRIGVMCGENSSRFGDVFYQLNCCLTNGNFSSIDQGMINNAVQILAIIGLENSNKREYCIYLARAIRYIAKRINVDITSIVVEE